MSMNLTSMFYLNTSFAMLNFMTQHFSYLTAQIFPQMIDDNVSKPVHAHVATKFVQHWNFPYLNKFDHLVSFFLSKIDKFKYISYSVSLMEKITGMSFKNSLYLPLPQKYAHYLCWGM